VDAPVCRFRDTDDNGTLDETLYYCQDANMNTTALVSASGSVVERYLYDPYGKVTILDGTTGGQTDWATDADQKSDVDNEVLYAGYRLDPETNLFHVRRRYYHATLGRWLSRDPAGYQDGMSLYEYCSSSPLSATDWLGLQAGDALLPRMRPYEFPTEDELKLAETVLKRMDWTSSVDIVGNTIALKFAGDNALPTGEAQRTRDAARAAIERWWGSGNRNTRSAEYLALRKMADTWINYVNNQQAMAAAQTPEGQAILRQTEFSDRLQIVVGLAVPVALAGPETVAALFVYELGVDALMDKVDLPPEVKIHLDLFLRIEVPIFCGLVHGEYQALRAEQAGVDVARSSAAARRAYLNQKFGRTGNLDADITAARGYASGVQGVPGADGIIAQNGTRVTGFTSHGIDRAIGDAAKRVGTKPQAILDALKNPQRVVRGVDMHGRPFQIFIGHNARVVVNPQTGKVVSVNPLSGAGAQ
jgi:RHS repeat-associated protein